MFPLLLLVIAADPVPTIKLPAEVKASPGRLVQLKAETTGATVKWALTSDEADLIPFPDGKLAVFAAAKPGRYLVLAWTATGNEPSDAARCVIVVGDAKPIDPFAAELRKLYDADTSAEKANRVQQLAALYREAITTVEKPEIRTAGQLADRLKAAAALAIPNDALIPLRKRLAEEIAQHLPTDAAQVLEAKDRRDAAQLFDRIATTLEGLK
jgi:hypothetical protein